MEPFFLYILRCAERDEAFRADLYTFDLGYALAQYDWIILIIF